MVDEAHVLLAGGGGSLSQTTTSTTIEIRCNVHAAAAATAATNFGPLDATSAAAGKIKKQNIFS